MADKIRERTVHITPEKTVVSTKCTTEKNTDLRENADSGNSTVFDDVLKTIQEKMPEFAVPLINEAFGTKYSSDVEVIPWRQEHHTKNGKIYVDTHLLIKSKHYHLECQLKKDGSMIIRMWEYDTAIALENVEEENGRYRIRFPQSCVLQLRGKNKFDKMDMEIVLQDGQSFIYSVPVIWLSDFSRNEIFQKRLIFLLPFYIIKYENKIGRLEQDREYLESMLKEYREIESYLERELLESNREKAFRDIVELIKMISDHVLRNSSQIRQEVDYIMGGKVLKLQTDIEYEQGEKHKEEQLNSLNRKLLSAGRIDDLYRSCTDRGFQKQLLEEYGL